MVNVHGKKLISTVLSILMIFSIFITLPASADSVNAAASAPSNLKVTKYSDTVAVLNWSAVSDAAGYIVYYSTDNSSFTKLKTISSQSTVSYSASGLTAGKTYYFALASYTTSGSKTTVSSRSSSVKVTTTSSSTLPYPTSFKVSSYSSSAIKLTWSKASSITGYCIYRSTDGKSYSRIKTVSSSTASYTDSSLKSGTKYYYKICSYTKSSAGVIAFGVKSSAVSATTTSSSTLPYPTSFKVSSYSSSAVKLTWSKASSATGYQLYRSTDGKTYSKIKTVLSSTTSYTDSSLSAATKYYYKIRSYTKSSSGVIAYGPVSSAVSATTTSSSTVPAPTSFTASAYSSSAIKLTWTAASGVTGYQLYRSTDGKTYSKIKTMLSSTTSYTDSSLSAATKYYYKIRSYTKSSAGVIAYGPVSSAVSATTASNAALTTPTGFAVKESNPIEGIVLSWNAVSSATGYYIYRSTDNSTFTQRADVSSSSTTYTDASPGRGMTYYYKIAAYNDSKTSSMSSSVTTTTLKNAVNITSTSSTSSTVTIQWDAYDSADGYLVYRKGADGDSTSYAYIGTTTSTSYTDTGLTGGKYYYYKMRAYYIKDGVTYYSPYDACNQKTCPSPVEDFTASALTYYTIQLDWTESSSASSYEIYMLAPNASSYELVATVSSGNSSYLVHNLDVDSKYTFRIRIASGVGSSKLYSTYSTATVSTKSVTNEITRSDEIFELVNEYRTNNGKSELERDQTLDSLAAIRAQELSENYSGTRPNGSSSYTVLEGTDLYTDSFIYGECYVNGKNNAESVVKAWDNNSTTNSIMYKANCTKAGVAVYYDSSKRPYYILLVYRA